MHTRTCLLILGSALLFSCKSQPTVKNLLPYAPTETYAEDRFLDTVSSKRALVILAHDDDDCAMAGTIARLHQAGWQIEQWSLEQTELAPGRTTHPATIICQGNKPIVEDGLFRSGKTREKDQPAYYPIALNELASYYQEEKVAAALVEKINAFRPAVLFTLDHEIGGYGHPDHVFISRLLYNLFREGRVSASRLYQSVFTKSMLRTIVEERLTKLLKEWGYENTYLLAKKEYGIDGQPEPNTQVNIRQVAALKMEYLRAYHPKARKNLRKFIPWYEDIDAETYFSVFDREFFRVLER